MENTTTEKVLAAVRRVAVTEGLAYVTRRRVAEEVGITETQVSRLATQRVEHEAKYEVGIGKLVALAFIEGVRAKDYELIARGIQAEYWRAVESPYAAKARRLHPEMSDERHGSPLSPVFVAADLLVLNSGFQNVTRELIAEKAQVSPATVSNAFDGMKNMPDTLMRWAINRGDAKMIARGVQVENQVARTAPPELLKRAAQTLLNF